MTSPLNVTNYTPAIAWEAWTFLPNIQYEAVTFTGTGHQPPPIKATQAYKWPADSSYSLGLNTIEMKRATQMKKKHCQNTQRESNVQVKFGVCMTVHQWYNNINNQLDAIITVY